MKFPLKQGTKLICSTPFSFKEKKTVHVKENQEFWVVSASVANNQSVIIARKNQKTGWLFSVDVVSKYFIEK